MNHRKELVLSINCLLLVFPFTTVWIQQQDENMVTKMSPEILRLHMPANSNFDEDQKLKLEVKSSLIGMINRSLPADAEEGEICTYIKEHQSDLERTAETYMEQIGYGYPVAVALTSCYFPTKIYGDVVLSCGNYNVAEVVTGSGRG